MRWVSKQRIKCVSQLSCQLNRKLIIVGWSTTLDWADPADDDKVRGLSIETTDKWEELGKARGSYLPFLFMNDASRDQNPLASYGAENLQRLKNIAARYDPKQLFQKVQNSGFLLSKA